MLIRSQNKFIYHHTANPFGGEIMKREIACIILSILILGCTTSYQPLTQQPGSQPLATPPSNASEVTVEISNFAFSPVSIEIDKGTKVTWVNKDSARHTVTGDGGEFDTGEFGNDENRSYTFTKAGSYPYHCGIHTYMKGTVTVR